MTDIPTHEDPARAKIIKLYVAFGLSIVLTVIPHVWAAAASMLMLLYTRIVAYVLRGRGPKDSLADNHATFVIRTIWLTGLFAIVTLAAGSAYLLERIDNAPLMPCMDKFLNMNPEKAAVMNVVDMGTLFENCMHPFVTTNWNALIVSMLIAGGPLLAYVVVRFARGLSRALKGYRLAKPKAWF